MSYIKHKYLSEFRVSLLTGKAPRFSVRHSNNRRRGRRKDDKEGEEDDIQSLLHRLMPLLRWSDQTWSANQHARTLHCLTEGGACGVAITGLPSAAPEGAWVSLRQAPRTRRGPRGTGLVSKQTYVCVHIYVCLNLCMHVHTYIDSLSLSLTRTQRTFVATCAALSFPGKREFPGAKPRKKPRPASLMSKTKASEKANKLVFISSSVNAKH